MMDPLSICASIAGLLRTTHLLAKGIRALPSVKHAPDNFVALCGEVAMLQTTLEQLQNNVKPVANDASPLPVSLLKLISEALRNVEKIVMELEGLSSRLHRSPLPLHQRGFDHKTSNCSDTANQASQVRKCCWLREKGAIEQLSQDSQRAREELGLCIGLVVIFCEIQTSRSAIRESGQTQQQLEEKLALVRIYWETQCQKFQQQLELITPQTSTAATQGKDSRNGQETASRRDWLQETARCEPTCPCRCHGRTHLHSQLFSSLLFGVFTVNYGTPSALAAGGCDHAICGTGGRSAIKIGYRSPSWLLRRAFHVTASVSFLTGVGASLTLHIPRVINRGCLVGWAILRNDLGLVRDLFSRREVFPSDIDHEWGSSLLAWAISHDSWDVISHLIDIGCDPTFADNFGLSPVAIARKKMLLGVKEYPVAAVNILSRVLDTAGPENSTFSSTAVHRATLDANPLVLEKALRASPSDLDAGDEAGLSPLHWATESGNVKAVQTLLDWGADPNPRLESHLTPLHFAASGAVPEAQEIGMMLLKSGADISAEVMPRGLTVLHMGWDGIGAKSLAFYEAVLEAGADPNRRLPKNTTYGSTPLESLLWGPMRGAPNSLNKVKTLLRRGADPNLPGFSGYTPLLFLIKHG
ncbi:ankyrin repeat-containing domain protein [Podospora aff. communis PSN243]|uniref:Ankyrin repeat-containing domain protein n=1 Tax=Podospora aff. communis PSN243 TaxID=3040156 RepID=A0AAV9G564_9PEZI|nr:ankyrin repeat-containing domain protein [Podospora aff. communis PSN243]